MGGELLKDGTALFAGSAGYEDWFGVWGCHFGNLVLKWCCSDSKVAVFLLLMKSDQWIVVKRG